MKVEKLVKICPSCGKSFEILPCHKGRIYCSRKCANSYKGKIEILKMRKGWKHTDESKKKMSDNHADVRGENNPMYGTHRSEETRKKISEKILLRKERDGYINSPEVRKKHSQRMKGENSPSWKGGLAEKECLICKRKFEVKPCHKDTAKYCSLKCYWKSISGDNSRFWIHGESRFPYPLVFNVQLKNNIRKRDNYLCQLCGKSQNEEVEEFDCKLAVHHINYDKSDCREDNLITLCRKCNSRANSNRKKWISFFQDILLL